MLKISISRRIDTSSFTEMKSADVAKWCENFILVLSTREYFEWIGIQYLFLFHYLFLLANKSYHEECKVEQYFDLYKV